MLSFFQDNFACKVAELEKLPHADAVRNGLRMLLVGKKQWKDYQAAYAYSQLSDTKRGFRLF